LVSFVSMCSGDALDICRGKQWPTETHDPDGIFATDVLITGGNIIWDSGMAMAVGNPHDHVCGDCLLPSVDMGDSE